MKKIATFMIVCMAGFAHASLVSCSPKVDKAELDKKVMTAMNSDKEPEFTDAEYQFMADYLYDNYDEIDKLDITDKNAEIAMAYYFFILAAADLEGKLNKETKEKYELFRKKIYSSDYYKNYKETETAIMNSLQTSDIDWEDAFEADDEGDGDVVSEYEVVEEY